MSNRGKGTISPTSQRGRGTTAPVKRRILDSTLRRHPSVSDLNKQWNVDRQSIDRARQQAVNRANADSLATQEQRRLIQLEEDRIRAERDTQLREEQVRQQQLLEQQLQRQHLIDQQARPADQQAMMTAQSFHDYMEQDRGLRAQETQSWVSQMREDRRQDDVYQRERLELATRQVEHQEAEAQYRLAIEIAGTIPPCNGDNEKSVREWLKEIDMTLSYTDQQILVACRSSRTPLRREIETFLGDKAARRHKTWPQLKAHVIGAFLDSEEEERKKIEVESMKQGAYESTAAYGRRFREAVEEAYPLDYGEERNGSEARMLWRYYLKGLRDNSLSEKITSQGGQKDFELAITKVATIQAKKERVKVAREGGWVKSTGSRLDEPMDINNLDINDTEDLNAVEEPEDLAATVRRLERKMLGVSSHLTKVTSAVEKMADNLAMYDQINLRARPYQNTANTTQLHSTVPHDGRFMPEPYRPSEYYVPQGQGHPREPPLTATPNTGFYGFTPDRPQRNPQGHGSKQVSFERTPEGAPVCGYCHKTGHLAKDCRSRRQGRSGGNTQGNPGRRQQQGRSSQGGR